MAANQTQTIAQTWSLRARSLRPLAWLLPCLLILLPAFALNRLVNEHQVNHPFLDDWNFVDLGAKVAAEPLTSTGAFAAPVEPSLGLARSITRLFHRLTPAAYTSQMWFSWTLLLLTMGNLSLLWHRTAGVQFRSFWPVLALSSLVIFSPVQYQVLLWAHQFQAALPAFFLSLAVVAFLIRLPGWFSLGIGIACAVGATLSFSTGVLLWVLMPALILGTGSFQGKWRILALLVWLTAGAITCFISFHLPAAGPHLWPVGPWEEMSRFILRLLGSHLARGSAVSVMTASFCLGLLSLVLYSAAGLYWAGRFHDQRLRRRLLPWLVLGMYSIGAAALIALQGTAGRHWEDAAQARHVVHAMPLTVALIALVSLIGQDLRSTRSGRENTILRGFSICTILFVSIQAVSWMHGMRMMEVWKSVQLQSASAALFYKVVPGIEGVSTVHRERARKADDLGLLQPAMLASARLDNFRAGSSQLSANTAVLSSLALDSSGPDAAVVAKGYACLPDRTRVADAILFTYRSSPDGPWHIFHITQVDAPPLFLTHLLARDLQFTHVFEDSLGQSSLSGFSARFLLSELPPGRHFIAAWAFNFERRQAYPISGAFEIDTTKATVKPLLQAGK